jgi:hypothetical protein
MSGSAASRWCATAASSATTSPETLAAVRDLEPAIAASVA